MTREEAEAIVCASLNDGRRSSDDEVVILSDMTIVKPYGWIFFFNSKSYVATKNILFALGGNGPVVFENANRRITSLGSARPPDEEIAEFERQMPTNRSTT
jgi:hypothetical protein